MAVQRTLPAKQITLNMALAVDSISFDAVRVALNLVANMQRLEMTARFFIQRLELSGISEQRRQPVSKIDYQKLREIAEKTKIAGEAPVMPFDQRINALNDFMKHFSPDIALALLDERERNQQYIKSRDQENEEIALTVGKLRVELEAADNNLIDSECHGAELEESLRDKQALLESSEKRIAELSRHLQCAHDFIEHTEAFGYEASNGILCCGDAQWNIDSSKAALASAGSVNGEG